MSVQPPSLLFRRHVTHLASKLHPLLSVSSGLPHPDFPASLLHYHILTEAQLDDLAHFYHQRTPTALSFAYPAPVMARWVKQAPVEDKRRRFGRFVGLRGCESPVVVGGGKSEEERAMERRVDERIRDGVRRERELEEGRMKRF